MNNFARLALGSIFFFAILNNAPAQTQSVYTWTDEKGVVHYTDTPPDNPNAVEIPATEVYRPGSTGAYPPAEAEEIGDEQDPAAVASPADDQRNKLDEARKESQEKQAERARICKAARDRLETIEPSRRVFYTNEQGETVRLDDEERVAMVEQAKALIAANCD